METGNGTKLRVLVHSGLLFICERDYDHAALLALKKGTESASPGTTISHEYWVRRNLSAELAGVIRYALKSAENTESGRFSEKPETNGAVRFSKPSKALPHFVELLIEPVHKHPDTSAYRVISGAIPDTMKILELLNQWSHLFYTGNGKVPRIVTSAAAERLTPCSLELGWKSPVIVDAAFDREFAAKRILGFEKAYNSFFPKWSASRCTLWGHRKQLSLQARGVFDGRRNPARRWFELVIVEGVDENDSLLQEEIPGALLPIAAVDSLDEAIGSVDAGLDQVQYEPLTSMSIAGGGGMVGAPSVAKASSLPPAALSLGVGGAPFNLVAKIIENVFGHWTHIVRSHYRKSAKGRRCARYDCLVAPPGITRDKFYWPEIETIVFLVTHEGSPLPRIFKRYSDIIGNVPSMACPHPDLSDTLAVVLVNVQVCNLQGRIWQSQTLRVKRERRWVERGQSHFPGKEVEGSAVGRVGRAVNCGDSGINCGAGVQAPGVGLRGSCAAPREDEVEVDFRSDGWDILEGVMSGGGRNAVAKRK
ncbi:Aldehyde/histidinol dehydrogenase [Pisolithus microcarpus]|nr:Aldehyde/histidinol dehydrogenase [Pisolithus microcarpus]